MKLQQKNGQVALRLSEKVIYFAGGTDITRSRISSKSYRYHLESQKVEELPKLNTARFLTSITASDKHVYVIGGRGLNGVPLAECESLDPNDPKKWVAMPNMSKPRVGHVTWCKNGMIYVLGGTTFDTEPPLSEVAVFDIEKNSWSTSSSKLLLT